MPSDIGPRKNNRSEDRRYGSRTATARICGNEQVTFP